jgi:hypothetical protein
MIRIIPNIYKTYDTKSMDAVKFKLKGQKSRVYGYPELENCDGIADWGGMAFFWDKNTDFYIVNTQKGKIRRFSTARVLQVNDGDIDLDAIAKSCRNGFGNAQSRSVMYGKLDRWDNFRDGICAIVWTLYPDGIYFGDSDGFGVENDLEETVYAIIDDNLDIIEPFRPIQDISAYLKELRKRKREAVENR